MLIARIEVIDSAERRAAERRSGDSPSTVRTNEAKPIDVMVRDLSRTGISFTCSKQLMIGSMISIGLSGPGVIRAEILRRDGDNYGSEFEAPLTPSALAAAFGPSSVARLPSLGQQPLAIGDVPYDKFPAPVRVILIVTSAILAWICLGAIAVSVWS